MNFDEVFDLATLKLALRHWYILLLVLAVSFVLGVATYALLPRKYQVTAVIIGTRFQSDITPSNQQISFSAASLLGTATNDLPVIADFKLFSQLLTSTELGKSILNDPIVHRIFPKQWHGDHWAPPDTLSQHVANIFYGLIGQPAWVPPDGDAVARYLQGHLTIVTAKDAKILTVSVWMRDAELGKGLITLVTTQADNLVKHMAQKRFKAKVAFLEEALRTASVQETRTVLGTNLAKAETDEIYSYSDLPYAAEFSEPPGSPALPQFPDIRWVMGAFLLGGVMVFFTYIVLLKRKTHENAQLSLISAHSNIPVPVKRDAVSSS